MNNEVTPVNEPFELPKLTCDVCGGEAVGVAASPLGPISFAYCTRCLREGAEPYGMIVATVAGVGSLEQTADWAKKYIEPTLRITGKTMEEFEADIEKAIQEEREYWDAIRAEEENNASDFPNSDINNDESDI